MGRMVRVPSMPESAQRWLGIFDTRRLGAI